MGRWSLKFRFHGNPEGQGEAPLPVLTRSYGERGWGEGASGVDARNLRIEKLLFMYRKILFLKNIRLF